MWVVCAWEVWGERCFGAWRVTGCPRLSASRPPWLADPSALLERFGGGRAAAAALLARGGGAGGGLGSPLARGAAEAEAALRELAGALHERSLEV